jgi:hypothetical protein
MNDTSDFTSDFFSFGDNYLYETKWYYQTFPMAWARSHAPLTGPNECQNCAHHGSLHDGSIFVGYCINCAKYVYHYTRGHGFVEGAEVTTGVPEDAPLSAHATYLQGIDLDNVPPLLVDEEEEEDFTGSILECHFEGGYNDF